MAKQTIRIEFEAENMKELVDQMVSYLQTLGLFKPEVNDEKTADSKGDS